MVPPAITTQPLPTSENLREDVNTLLNSNSENLKDVTKNENLKEVTQENLKEVTAVFDEAGHMEGMTEEEKEKKRERRREDNDCCCVYPYYSDDTDAFCVYILCHWICDCFRGIGVCTESCFECCANCLGECCEGDACCDCNGGDAAGDAGDGCADCFSGCSDCCSSCDCDCSS